MRRAVSGAEKVAAERAALRAVGPVVVELTGITGPAEFSQLSDALIALWESMRVLSLGTTQYSRMSCS